MTTDVAGETHPPEKPFIEAMVKKMGKDGGMRAPRAPLENAVPRPSHSQRGKPFWRQPISERTVTVLQSCGRRRRIFLRLARDILLARDDGRSLSPAAWVAILVLLALCIQAPQIGLFLIPSAFLFVILCFISIFDARYFVIPDGPLILLALGGCALAASISPQEFGARLLAGAGAYAALQIVALGYEALRSRPGVGAGDAKLFAVAGLWTGFSGLPSCLVYAVVSALLSAVIALRLGSLENARQPIPFGPHLALGLWLVWAVGPLEGG